MLSYIFENLNIVYLKVDIEHVLRRDILEVKFTVVLSEVYRNSKDIFEPEPMQWKDGRVSGKGKSGRNPGLEEEDIRSVLIMCKVEVSVGHSGWCCSRLKTDHGSGKQSGLEIHNWEHFSHRQKLLESTQHLGRVHCVRVLLLSRNCHINFFNPPNLACDECSRSVGEINGLWDVQYMFAELMNGRSDWKK